MAGVKKEVWTGEIVRQMTYAGDFLAAVPSADKYVENDVIHINKLGMKPDVLINNTTYPIPIQDTDDTDIVISLDKFQTKQTEISDDEIEYITYDKVKEYATLHAESLEEVTARKAAHALCPALHTALTPVIATTGAHNAASVHSLTVADIADLKKYFDDQLVPADPANRILVLCSQHVNDLLKTDEQFNKQYKDNATGKVLNLFGFTIYEFAACPTMYLDTVWKKRAFGAAAVAGDRQVSFAFYTRNVFKARGSVKMYMSLAAQNPATQSTLFNYKLRFVSLPKVNEMIGALVSPDA